MTRLNATDPEALSTVYRELLDKQLIRECVLLYSRGLDRRDGVLLRSLLHDDVVFENPALPAPGYSEVGGEASVAGTITALEQVPATVHLVPSTLVELDGDVAWAESHGLTFSAHEDAEGLLHQHEHLVRLLDRWERREGGPWKLAYRRVVPGPFSFDHSATGASAARATKAEPTEDPVYHLREWLSVDSARARLGAIER